MDAAKARAKRREPARGAAPVEPLPREVTATPLAPDPRRAREIAMKAKW